MNARTRLLLGIGLPILLIIVIVGGVLWRNNAMQSTATAPVKATGPAANAPKEMIPMTLAMDWTPNTNHTGIYVALENGWYRDQGIDLKLLPYSSSISPDTLVSSGKADVGISFTEGVVADMAAGQPVVSIGAIAQHNTSALVTLADSGLNSPRDLDGKTYGGFGAPYETPVVSQIIKHDGGKGTFKNVTLDVGAMDALKAHRIDFVWVYQGWEVIQAQREGVKLNVFPIVNYGVTDYYTPVIISSPNEIKQKPDLLKRFMAATTQGYDFARANAKEAAQILIKEAPKGTFPDTGLVFASQDYLSPRYADSGRKWGLQDTAAWHGYPEFILQSGGVTDAAGKTVTNLDLDAMYTNQFLP